MDLKGKKIIVVEDDKINVYLLKALLAKTKADVTFCGSADEFYQEFNDDFDIILLDLRIPGEKQGKDILKDMKDKNSTPVIIQTAFPDEEKECRELGADEFIDKPHVGKLLIPCIKKLLK